MIRSTPRRYEVRKIQSWSRQYGFRCANSLAEAVTIAEDMGEEEGCRIRIREYELSGVPGLPPIRPDRILSLDEARDELGIDR